MKTQAKCFFRNGNKINFQINLLIAVALVLTPIFAPLFIQSSAAAYKPPKTQKPPSTYTESSGVRGRCKESISANSITLLAPIRHVGQTSSSHPKLAWFVDNSQPIPMELSFYEFDSQQKPKLIHKQTITSYPGKNQFQLTSNQPGLLIGNRYMWQLQTKCNYNRPSQDLVLRAEVERVNVPVSVLQALNQFKSSPMNTTTLTSIVQTYAEHGLWYDALDRALAIAPPAKIGEVAADLLNELAQVEGDWERVNLSRIAINLM